jgi:hypothetical protein
MSLSLKEKKPCGFVEEDINGIDLANFVPSEAFPWRIPRQTFPV